MYMHTKRCKHFIGNGHIPVRKEKNCVAAKAIRHLGCVRSIPYWEERKKQRGWIFECSQNEPRCFLCKSFPIKEKNSCIFLFSRPKREERRFACRKNYIMHMKNQIGQLDRFFCFFK